MLVTAEQFSRLLEEDPRLLRETERPGVDAKSPAKPRRRGCWDVRTVMNQRARTSRMRGGCTVAKMFTGHTALITGASSGIGRATAVAFASEGAKVTICSRREDESLETLKLIEAAGSEGFFKKTDVSDSLEVQALVAETIERYGQPNYAFNNAGSLGDSFVPVAKYSEVTCDQVITVN
jgi:short chain dehydrogenase